MREECGESRAEGSIAAHAQEKALWVVGREQLERTQDLEKGSPAATRLVLVL